MGQMRLLFFIFVFENTFMRVVSSLSLVFVVLSSFFSFDCFLRFAAGVFWPRFVLVSDVFLADCILFSAFSLFD